MQKRPKGGRHDDEPIVGTIVFFVLRQTLAGLGSLYLMTLGLIAIADARGAEGSVGRYRRPVRLAGVSAGAPADASNFRGRRVTGRVTIL
jgi:hypothetical protein